MRGILHKCLVVCKAQKPSRAERAGVDKNKRTWWDWFVLSVIEFGTNPDFHWPDSADSVKSFEGLTDNPEFIEEACDWEH